MEKIKEKIYDLTPEIYKALSSTGYSGKTMKEGSDTLMMNNFVRNLGYTSVGKKIQNENFFFVLELPKRAEDIHNKTFDEVDLEGQGVKTVIPSNIIDIYTRLEISLGP